MDKLFIHTIGDHVAEHEADSLPRYYLENDYYLKASSFSMNSKELFFIGRTGSGKSAILEMIRRNRYDASRVLSITSDDFATQLLLSHPDISKIPKYLKPLIFKSLWKYIIISNILKIIYGQNSSKWRLYTESENDDSYQILLKFGELISTKRSLTDQVLSFIQTIKKIENLEKMDKADASNKLYKIFKIVYNFEKKELSHHIKNYYLHVLFDDLDKNWTGKEENIDLIKTLFECIIELSRKYRKNLKFVVALRTDIFSQIDFHQTEKIRPYVINITWDFHQLKKLVEKRIEKEWNVTASEAWNVFPRYIRVGNYEMDIFQYFIIRTLWRPRDLISFINLCINEALKYNSGRIEMKDIYRAEAIYSRQRMEALVDEWKFVYPELISWVDLFAGGKIKYRFDELEHLFKNEKNSAKAIIDVLYSVGFLGYKPFNKSYFRYSFKSQFGVPLKESDFIINRTFQVYLRDRAEELGKYVEFNEKSDDDYSEIIEESETLPQGQQKELSITVSKPIRILAIFANPKGTNFLRLSEEERVLNECIKLSKLRDDFKLRTCNATQIHDLRRALLEHEYDIIHFSGHGTGKGLAFEDINGNINVVPQKALADLLFTYSPPLKCAILNACYSIDQADLISLGVPFTISMNGSIADNSAIEFSRGFYDAIGAGKDINFAYEEGCRAISLMGFSGDDRPKLNKKGKLGSNLEL